MRLEGIGQLKYKMALSGIKPETFRLVAQCLNQLRYGVRRKPIIGPTIYFNFEERE
jgi:hypothetical protein